MGKVRKQTSSRVSTLAARLLRRMAEARADWDVMYTERDSSVRDICRIGDLRTLCTSLISQDETRGQAKRHR